MRSPFSPAQSLAAFRRCFPGRKENKPPINYSSLYRGDGRRLHRLRGFEALDRCRPELRGIREILDRPSQKRPSGAALIWCHHTDLFSIK